MKIGPVDMGKEYRGSVWDIALYFLPGLITFLGVMYIFQWYNNTNFIRI